MTTKKTNTTASIETGGNDNAKLAGELAKAQATFAGEELVPFSVPKALAKFVGPNLYIAVNGVFVNVPVDGKKYDIPKTLAEHGFEYLANLKI